MEITVILTSFNCKEHIDTAIKSVEAQSYKKWNMLVFDDGSKDGSLDIIEARAKDNPKIKLLKHPGNENKGLAQTLKKALSCVKTDYCAFLECDDYWHKDYLKEKAAVAGKNKNIDIIYNDVNLFGDKKRIKKLNLYYKAVNFYLKILNPFTQNYNLQFPLLSFNPVPTFSCVMVKTSLLDNLDFNPPFSPWLDRWLWTQLCFKNNFYFLNKKLTFWQLRSNSYTMNTLGDIAKNETPFKQAVSKMYAQQIPPLKFYLFRYTTLILELIFTVATLPFRLLFK